jgi:hypothetical protein
VHLLSNSRFPIVLFVEHRGRPVQSGTCHGCAGPRLPVPAKKTAAPLIWLHWPTFERMADGDVVEFRFNV